jgi:hypothetical protein
MLEILEGLSSDDDVVVVGKSSLVDGQTVQASPYNLPSGKPAKQRI